MRWALIPLVAIACHQPPSVSAPRHGFAAKRDVALALASTMTSLERTPLARIGVQLREKAEACSGGLVADVPSEANLERLVSGLRCDPGAVIDPKVAIFRVPIQSGFLRVTLEPTGPDLAFELAFEGDGFAALSSDLLGEPNALSARGLVAHARWKPKGGIDLAALSKSGGQADELFRLRNELFTKAVLNGTIELGIYGPKPGGKMPRVALVLGTRSTAAAEEGLSRFIDDLAKRWPIHPTPTRILDTTAICLGDLNILPELAPCGLSGARGLVVGWNAASLEAALGTGDRARLLGSSGAIWVDFDRVREADQELARTASAAPTILSLPFRRLELLAEDAPGFAKGRFSAEL